MFRIFQSIFGGNEKKGSYPESLVKAAIERAVEGTDPWMRAVSGYKRKLRPSVLQAIDHVVALVDSMPPPVTIDADAYEECPQVRAVFISRDDMNGIIAASKELAEFRTGSGDVLAAYALLLTEKRERGILGAELSGDIVMHGVPQVTISFEAHRLIDPCSSEAELRRKLKHRAFDHLLSLALKRITIVKTERGNIENYRALLESKLNLLNRAGWGFNDNAQERVTELAKAEELLSSIESQLNEIGRDDQMLAKYLDILVDVLSNPGAYLWAGQETLIVDRMGIKRSEAASDAAELVLDVMTNAEGRSLVYMPVMIPLDKP